MAIPRGLKPTEQDRHDRASDVLKWRYGLPASQPAIFSSVTAAVVGPRWADYRVENLGIVVPTPTADKVPWLPWWLPLPDGGDLHVQTWVRWVRCHRSQAYIIARWLPAEWRTQFNVENLHPYDPADREITLRGWDLLRFENAQVPGAKKETREAAQQRLRSAIQTLSAEGRKVSTVALSEVLVVEPGAIDKLKQRAGWFRQDLEREWNEYRKLQFRRDRLR
ncbi:MAG: hypothetical protein GEU28_13155 [Dehalococcoidia bacterium]|nr:hypothetical protein [Dehalococcoidia bacterium]